MVQQFSLFQTPLDFSKRYWQMLTGLQGVVVDATCGGGFDTCYLADLLPYSQWRKIFSFDIQPEAIEKAKKCVGLSHGCDSVQWVLDSHENIDRYVQTLSAVLIVFNLGYFPGGDKSITTKSKTTLQSVKKALPLLIPGGVVSITCYPGHEEGAIEERLLVKELHSLSPKEWSVSYHTFQNRNKSPSQLFIQKTALIVD